MSDAIPFPDLADGKRIGLVTCDYLPSIIVTSDLIHSFRTVGAEVTVVSTGSCHNVTPREPPSRTLESLYWALFPTAVMPVLLRSELACELKRTTALREAEAAGFEYVDLTDINLLPRHLNGVYDAVVLIRSPQIVRGELLADPRIKRWLNLHGGLLPNYRGLNVLFPAFLNNEVWYGWTLHNLTTKIDVGSVIASFKLPMSGILDAFSASMLLAEGVVGSLKQAGDIHLRGRTPDKCPGKYYTNPSSGVLSHCARTGLPVAILDTVPTIVADAFAHAGSRANGEIQGNVRKFLSQATLEHCAVAAGARGQLRRQLRSIHVEVCSKGI